MTIWNYLLIVSLIMNFWCVAKIDRHDKAIHSLSDAGREMLDILKESNDHVHRLFSDLLRIVKGESHNANKEQ